MLRGPLVLLASTRPQICRYTGQWRGNGVMDKLSPLEGDIEAGRVRIGPDGAYMVTSWDTVDLEVVKSGEPRPGTEYLARTDGRCLIYAGLPHTICGESESLKSWAALLACRSYIDSGFAALYVDFEGDEWTVVERARIVGIPEGAIGCTFRYTTPAEPLKGNTNAIADLLLEEIDLKPSLVVLDGVPRRTRCTGGISTRRRTLLSSRSCSARSPRAPRPSPLTTPARMRQAASSARSTSAPD